MTMGNQPNYYAPQPGFVPMPAKRPGAVTAVSIIAIIIGGLGVLCCGLSNLVGATGMMGEAQMPDGTVIKQDPDVATVGVILGLITVVTSGALLVVGIGGLRLAKWARSIGMIVAAVVLLVALGRFIVTVTFTGPKTEQMMKKMEEAMAKNQKSGQPPPPQMAKLMSSMTIGVGVAVLLFEALTPVLILTLWNKANVKQAFESGGAAGGFPGQMQYGYGPGPVPGQPPYGQGYPQPGQNYPPGGNPPPPVA